MFQIFKKYYNGMTLVELILALLLLSVVVMTGISMELGMRRIYTSTDLEAQLMSEAAPIITLIAKKINLGVGDISNSSNWAFDSTPTGNDTSYSIHIDSGNDGMADRWVTFSWKNFTTDPNRYQLWYYPNNATASYDVLSSRVIGFSISSPDTGTGFSTISLTLQRNPGAAFNLTNPNVTISSSAQFRGYSLI